MFLNKLKTFSCDVVLALLIWALILPFNPYAYAQPIDWRPNGWSHPPCAQNEVEDQYCSSWLTDPDTGNSVCAPNGMINICVPMVNNDGDVDDKNNILYCQQDQRVCVDDTPSKMIDGIEVFVEEVDGCWRWRRDYTCSSPNKVDTCEPFRENSACSVKTRRCIDNDPAFGCMEHEIVYECLVQRGSSHQVEVCGDTSICIGGICWDTSYPPDEDFAEVMTNMEVARQAGVYSPEGVDIFGGQANSCRSKRGAGLKNCCTTDTQGSAQTNNAVMGEFVSGATGFALRAGSKFVLDSLYGDTINWLGSGMSAAAANIPGGTGFMESISNPGFSFYGFSIGGAGSFLGTQSYTLIGAQGSFPGLYFNPYALAVALAIQIIMSAMSCSEEEAMLAMRRGANLCTPKIGDWCSKKVLGVCITRKQSYCCYNSKFSKIVNMEGRAQLGLGWGNPKAPDCSGFNAGQLGSIDFSRIDFSEVFDDVMNAYDPTFMGQDRENATGTVLENVGGWTTEACERIRNASSSMALPAECQ